MEAALYDPEGGFFALGRGAGRAGRDFVTSPEVGSLFGACVARALDGLWRALGEPDPFLVVEAGAGNGRLARDVLRAQPDCTAALRYVLVDRAPALRAQQRDLLDLEPVDEALGPFVQRTGDEQTVPEPAAGPVVAALDELPAVEADGAVVLANELLDNLPFGIAEWDGEHWQEVRVTVAGEDAFAEVLVPATESDAAELSRDSAHAEIPPGTRLPIPRGMREWLRDCDRVLRRGFLVVIDYFVTVEELRQRGGATAWLRTYREHQRADDPLDRPGTQDITADVVTDQFRVPDFREIYAATQAEWLREIGIDDLVEQGRRVWHERSHLGDIEALAGRSRAVEAAALTDYDGLGAHEVRLFARRLGDEPGRWPG
jgi:SAM-dependent MidA family methyltransferase